MFGPRLGARCRGSEGQRPKKTGRFSRNVGVAHEMRGSVMAAIENGKRQSEAERLAGELPEATASIDLDTEHTSRGSVGMLLGGTSREKYGGTPNACCTHEDLKKGDAAHFGEVIQI